MAPGSMAVLRRILDAARFCGARPAALDRTVDLARIGRLDEVVVESRVRSTQAILALAVAGDGDQQGMAGIAARAQPARDLEAVEARQADVEHDHVRVEDFQRS